MGRCRLTEDWFRNCSDSSLEVAKGFPGSACGTFGLLITSSVATVIPGAL
jgi:hypothetical protein